VRRLAGWGALCVIPLAGLLVLLAEPSYDLIWENHPAHFWLVVLVGVLSFALGFLLAEAAARRSDARVLLVGIAFLATSGYLVLHALATPGVLLAGKNAGFQIASAIGLLEAGLFAAASAVRFHPETSAFLVRYRGVIYGLLVLHMAVWAAVSLSTLPPLDDPVTPEDTRGPLAALAIVGLLAYGFGVWRYWQLYQARKRPLPLAILVALVLLSEALFAVAFARNWQTTWWEWHLLMLVAFGVVGVAARREWRLEGSSAEIFSDIYEEQTRGHLEEVSVFFADLQGYTAFSERTPETEIKGMLDTYFPAAAAVLQVHGGELYNTIGDALMVVFRGPGHELRAGRTALDFQREMTRIADAHPGWPRFRAGVNSGEAVLGVIDAPGKRGYTATGDTVNLASRLEGQARAGEVVVSDTTYAALAESADVEELDPLSVKGKSEAVRAFVLRGLEP
jgi:class 3 adenylate cyclase